MANKKIDNAKLGIFVSIGIILLIFALYKVSKSSSFFSKDFLLKSQFKNVNGLMLGNNIRYAGIQIGTIENIQIINDSLIEIDMRIEDKMKDYIHKSDCVTIGTDGIVGNKLVNIVSSKDGSALVKDGDILAAKESLNSDEMMGVLNKTNNNIATISEELKSTVLRFNNSSMVWSMLNEKTIPDNMIASMVNVRNASIRADLMVAELQTMIKDIKQGKGSLGAILTDTAIAINLNQAVDKIKAVGDNANLLTNELNALTQTVKSDLITSKGAYNALLKDTTLALKINNSLNNVEVGTASFTQNMEALKHNFLFRGYFRKLEKQKKKEQTAPINRITID